MGRLFGLFIAEYLQVAVYQILNIWVLVIVHWIIILWFTFWSGIVKLKGLWLNSLAFHLHLEADKFLWLCEWPRKSSLVYVSLLFYTSLEFFSQTRRDLYWGFVQFNRRVAIELLGWAVVEVCPWLLNNDLFKPFLICKCLTSIKLCQCIGYPCLFFSRVFLCRDFLVLSKHGILCKSLNSDMTCLFLPFYQF